MSDLTTRINQVADKNKELLRVLAETDHAAPDLETQKRLVADLEQEAAAAANRVADIDKQRKKELKDHEKYRDSVMRRFAYKATGRREKFDAKAEKEEKEYFAILQAEHREKEVEKNIQAQLEEANQVKTGLEGELRKHNDMQAELDQMYNSLFAGPTPGFPDEDEKERASNLALQRYHESRTVAERQLQAKKILEKAMVRLGNAAVLMRDARGYSRADMFGGGAMMDMMERGALQQASIYIQEARQMIAMAQREDNQIRGLPAVNINTGNLVSDMLFDNIFTDMRFHEEIIRMIAELERGRRMMVGEWEAATARYRELVGDLKEKERDLESTRWELQKAREQAFEKVMASN